MSGVLRLALATVLLFAVGAFAGSLQSLWTDAVSIAPRDVSEPLARPVSLFMLEPQQVIFCRPAHSELSGPGDSTPVLATADCEPVTLQSLDASSPRVRS
jgi:hypothetical protein